MINGLYPEIRISNKLQMNKLIVFICFSIALSACGVFEEEDDFVSTAATTNFDKSIIENGEYSIGDSVKADIIVTPRRPVKRIIAGFIGFKPGISSGIIDEFDTLELDNMSTQFTYKLRFKIDQKYQGDERIYVSIDAFIEKPDPDGWVGGPLTYFDIRLKQ
jgi:hypothetical protein